MNLVNDRVNLDEIASLSQRGSVLSIVDLVEANTLTAEMAAYSLYLMSRGASALTAAMPQNSGKTTLLGCLLTGTPPASRIRMVTSADSLANVDAASDPHQTLLVHEISPAPIPGYLWGEDIRQAFGLIQPGCAFASCMHADTLAQLSQILTSDGPGISPSDILKIDLLCFLHMDTDEKGYRRRVATLYEAFGDAGVHRLIFEWSASTDSFSKHDDTELVTRLADRQGIPVSRVRDEIHSIRDWIGGLQASGARDFRTVRQEFVKLLASNAA